MGKRRHSPSAGLALVSTCLYKVFPRAVLLCVLLSSPSPCHPHCTPLPSVTGSALGKSEESEEESKRRCFSLQVPNQKNTKPIFYSAALSQANCFISSLKFRFARHVSCHIRPSPKVYKWQEEIGYADPRTHPFIYLNDNDHCPADQERSRQGCSLPPAGLS